MEQFFVKAFEFFGSIVRPNHLMFLLAVTSGFFLFGPTWIIAGLGIGESLIVYHFWIVLILIIAGGLQGISRVVETLSVVAKLWAKIWRNWVFSHIDLDIEAKVALKLLERNLPDPVELSTQLPAVRSLRQKLLIQQSYFCQLGEVDYFKLTEEGKIAARTAEISEFESRPNDKKASMLGMIVGKDNARHSNLGWMR